MRLTIKTAPENDSVILVRHGNGPVKSCEEVVGKCRKRNHGAVHRDSVKRSVLVNENVSSMAKVSLSPSKPCVALR